MSRFESWNQKKRNEIDEWDKKNFAEIRKDESVARKQTRQRQEARLVELQNVPIEKRDSAWRTEFDQLISVLRP